jgi:prepilin-type N-terminal cleavage/methylation domain-containing protein
VSATRVRRQGGFTLLETVVTLVIVALLVSMLMQALGQSMRLRTRILQVQAQSRQMLLQEAWFRESVVAAQPPTARGLMDAFDGDVREVSYVSAAPLAAQGSTRVRWWLGPDGEGRLALHYSDPQAGDLVVVPGPLSEAGFSYMDAGGQWVSQWSSTAPDEAMDDPGPDAGVLPRLLRFQASTAKGTRLHWLVHLPADLHASNRIDANQSGAADPGPSDGTDTKLPETGEL